MWLNPLCYTKSPAKDLMTYSYKEFTITALSMLQYLSPLVEDELSHKISLILLPGLTGEIFICAMDYIFLRHANDYYYR